MTRDNQNWRSRRLNACRATDMLRDVIANLGVEDGSQLPPVRDLVALTGEFNPTPTDDVKRELTNISASLLRLVLVLNDGTMSDEKLRTF